MGREIAPARSAFGQDARREIGRLHSNVGNGLDLEKAPARQWTDDQQAIGGLAADLAAGGLTLGGGMIVGAILGALGGTGLAKGFNLARGEDSASVRWSPELLERLTVTAVLRYLAVAHFGRGRGEWAEGEHPIFWQNVVEDAVAKQKSKVTRLLSPSPFNRDTALNEADNLPTVLRQIGGAVLDRLYPGGTGGRANED